MVLSDLVECGRQVLTQVRLVVEARQPLDGRLAWLLAVGAGHDARRRSWALGHPDAL